MAKDGTGAAPWPKIERHFFVCENARPARRQALLRPRGSARDRHGAAGGAGRATPSCGGGWRSPRPGCLGPCFEGPTIVVYPEAVWYVGVAAADVPEIVEQHMRGGRPVERLRRPKEDD